MGELKLAASTKSAAFGDSMAEGDTSISVIKVSEFTSWRAAVGSNEFQNAETSAAAVCETRDARHETDSGSEDFMMKFLLLTITIASVCTYYRCQSAFGLNFDASLRRC